MGVGRTGSSLIKNLSAEKYDIVAVDVDGASVQNNIEKYDINGVVGNGCLAPILVEAGAKESDLLIAVTDSDEMNILSCIVGKSLGVKNLIAQVRNPEYYSNFESMGEHLGIDMFVNLHANMADKITRIIKAPAEVNLYSFGNGKLELSEFPISEKSKACGKTLDEIRKNRKKDFLVVTIERGEEVIIPNGSTTVYSGDVVTVCAKHQELRDILGYFGIEKVKIQSAMILGCDEDTYYLASRLLEGGLSVKVIGRDKEKCEALKARLESLTVICDDYKDKDVLVREGIDDVDALVTMAPSDENNIVASLYARMREVPKIVTVVRSDEYREMLEDISLNLVLSPYELAGEAIATYIRSINVPKDSQIISMNKIAGGTAEALQFNIGKNPEFVGKRISELGGKIKQGVLLCAVLRKRLPIIPHGDTVLEENDAIVIASLKKPISKLEDVLK